MLELRALASSNKGLATKRYNTIVHLESFVFANLNIKIKKYTLGVEGPELDTEGVENGL